MFFNNRFIYKKNEVDNVLKLLSELSFIEKAYVYGSYSDIDSSQRDFDLLLTYKHSPSKKERRLLLKLISECKIMRHPPYIVPSTMFRELVENCIFLTKVVDENKRVFARLIDLNKNGCGNSVQLCQVNKKQFLLSLLETNLVKDLFLVENYRKDRAFFREEAKRKIRVNSRNINRIKRIFSIKDCFFEGKISFEQDDFSADNLIISMSIFYQIVEKCLSSNNFLFFNTITGRDIAEDKSLTAWGSCSSIDVLNYECGASSELIKIYSKQFPYKGIYLGYKSYSYFLYLLGIQNEGVVRKAGLLEKRAKLVGEWINRLTIDDLNRISSLPNHLYLKLTDC